MSKNNLTKRWRSDQIGDLTGRTVIVTGSNSGIGRVQVRTLAAHGARCILAVRNVEAGQAVVDEIGAAGGAASVAKLDLSSLESVRDFAHTVTEPIDLLINNAGVMAPPVYRETAEGHELQFGTNHLGHFALTGQLLPRLLAAEKPRVTTVSSLAHRSGGASVIGANGDPSRYNPGGSYGNSKLANLLFAKELQRRAGAAGAPLSSTASHPGVSNTNLFVSPDGMGANRVIAAIGKPLMGLVFPGPESGAESTLYAALVAEPGSYVGPQKLGESRGAVGEAKQSAAAQDQDLASRLWEVSEELTGVRYTFA